jgi:hypothetical protein
MYGVLRGQPSVATEMQGRPMPGRDILVPPPPWTHWARYCFPLKTAAELAAIAGKDERTAKRWLAGEFEPPQIMLAVLIAKLLAKS